jgi:hypothetical protein
MRNSLDKPVAAGFSLRSFFGKEAWMNLLWPIGIVIIASLAGLTMPLLMKLK